jgi:hypothetical protein
VCATFTTPFCSPLPPCPSPPCLLLSLKTISQIPFVVSRSQSAAAAPSAIDKDDDDDDFDPEETLPPELCAVLDALNPYFPLLIQYYPIFSISFAWLSFSRRKQLHITPPSVTWGVLLSFGTLVYFFGRTFLLLLSPLCFIYGYPSETWADHILVSDDDDDGDDS